MVVDGHDLVAQRIVAAGTGDRLDLVHGDLDHAVDGIDDQAEHAARDLDDEDPGRVGDLEHLAEAAGEVEDRQHPSAEVDQPLDETPRRRRHPGRRVADDLLHIGDGQPVALAVQREHDELALHLRLRVAGGAHEASLP